mmetsp:Transcript_8703/g.14778  ORF Transcript_8703/g.14778 Transcript_8703/m.14778 type:complete len:214 (-) Transcript_8703:586-1227(-)
MYSSSKSFSCSTANSCFSELSMCAVCSLINEYNLASANFHFLAAASWSTFIFSMVACNASISAFSFLIGMVPLRAFCRLSLASLAAALRSFVAACVCSSHHFSVFAFSSATQRINSSFWCTTSANVVSCWRRIFFSWAFSLRYVCSSCSSAWAFSDKSPTFPGAVPAALIAPGRNLPPVLLLRGLAAAPRPAPAPTPRVAAGPLARRTGVGRV